MYSNNTVTSAACLLCATRLTLSSLLPADWTPRSTLRLLLLCSVVVVNWCVILSCVWLCVSVRVVDDGAACCYDDEWI